MFKVRHGNHRNLHSHIALVSYIDQSSATEAWWADNPQASGFVYEHNPSLVWIYDLGGDQFQVGTLGKVSPPQKPSTFILALAFLLKLYVSIRYSSSWYSWFLIFSALLLTIRDINVISSATSSSIDVNMGYYGAPATFMWCGGLLVNWFKLIFI